MPLLVRVIIDAHPGERVVNLRLAELPRRGDVIGLPDGSRVAIKKVKAPRRGDNVDVYAYARPAD